MTTGSGIGTPIAPSTSAFTSSDAFAMMLRRNPWMAQRVVQEPVVGLVDGSNTRFNLASPPAVSATASFITSAGAAVTPSSVDYDSGALLLGTAPTTSIYASYTHSLLSNSDAYGLFEEGFSLMESMWSRTYYLLVTGDVKVISSSVSAVVDPVILTSTFSSRVPQTALVADCMFYAWVNSALAEATYNAMAVREQRASGLQIDRTRQPDAFKSLIEMAEKRLASSLVYAMTDAGAESDLYDGGAIAAIKSNWNAVNSWWQVSQGGIYAPA
jgi:hypothetical protein